MSDQNSNGAQPTGPLAAMAAQLLDVTQHAYALEAVLMTLTLTVIRSHPDPDRFREEWDQNIAAMWSTAAVMSGTGNPVLPIIQRIKEQIESGFPERRTSEE
ncbi:hypothetical protein [Dyella sp. 2HG41-7]|uniref:hypothetical protein n=1 Tax=Dyella sp. 2HG41-7 TaxID=2883239 RepID=UPI001F490CA5|nr:hypothetical protein [Dyella sp. 2HG41-7]